MVETLDEQELLDEVVDVVAEVGTDVILIESDDTEHEVRVSPPQETDSQEQSEVAECILPNKDIEFDIFRTQRMKIGTETFRIIDIQKIRSGAIINSYKFTIGK